MKVTITAFCGFILFVYIFLRFYPSFGGKTSKKILNSIITSKNYYNGKFINEISTDMINDSNSMFSMLKDYIKRNPNIRPKEPLDVEKVNADNLKKTDQPKLIWFGHSTFYIELEGKTILTDPMFSKTPSPVSFIGGKRYSDDLPIEIEDLPEIDAVVISHDHYDHLDYISIKKLKNKVKMFFVPLGVGYHLERWGIATDKIKELNWYEEIDYENLTLACTPSRHFSGRNINNRNSTLWCSWSLISDNTKIFFSGDGGYGPHFKEIGLRYGEFDLTLMECGQYDKRWANIHMLPEETVQAHLDLKGKKMLPMHWGAFTLAFHNWNAPAKEAVKAAIEKNVDIIIPKIGELVTINSKISGSSNWWK
ncbi:MAG: MBL fold metallo-hydrolase [Clostridiaceae bacterium]